MHNKQYKTIQIPNDAYETLKKFCELNGYKMGKLLEVLINRHCKIEERRILKVEPTHDKS